jgi:site-specific DNA-methyltransferase (adenine-specific)
LEKRAVPEAGAPSGEVVLPPDSLKYCLRAKCVKERKARGDDEKVELSDVWFDVHRIKHKRDRDAHPCQLPEKLMERIIRLTTRRGGWVFDPFCGAGTTAIAAAKLGRNFVVTDVDANYVRVTREKLAAMKENADLFGSFMVPRESVKKPRRTSTKREVELYLQSLARKLERVPTEKDVEADDATMLAKIDAIYPTRSAALKRAKVALADLV